MIWGDVKKLNKFLCTKIDLELKKLLSTPNDAYNPPGFTYVIITDCVWCSVKSSVPNWIVWIYQRYSEETLNIIDKWKFTSSSKTKLNYPNTKETMEVFLNGAELSLKSVISANSGNLINHWTMTCAQFKDGSTLVSYTWGGKFKYFEWQIFLSLNLLNSVKTFRKNSKLQNNMNSKWIVPIQSYCRQRVSGTNPPWDVVVFLHVTKSVSYGQPILVPHMTSYILQTITLFDSDKTIHLSISQIKGIRALYSQTLKPSKCNER